MGWLSKRRAANRAASDALKPWSDRVRDWLFLRFLYAAIIALILLGLRAYGVFRFWWE